MYRLDSILDTVRVGDALGELSQFPPDCVDVTVTSPPYNKRRKTNGWLVQTNNYRHFDDSLPEEAYEAQQIRVLNELRRITRPGGSVFYNHKIRWANGKLLHPLTWISETEWDLRQEIIWDRTLAANVRGWRFWQVEERIYWLYKPAGNHLVGDELESRHAKMGSIWRLQPVHRNADHPAPFPLELPLRAIYSMVGREPKVVLDPYCGTGTTLVAAKLLGHRWIGVDVSPDYVELARERIKNSESERDKADAELALHVVTESFTSRKARGNTNWPFKPDDTDDAHVSQREDA